MIEIVDAVEFDPEHDRIKDRKSIAWSGCQPANWDAIVALDAGKVGAVSFVWPDEGEFRETRGKAYWHFNEAHVGEFEPLLIDRQTARALVLIHGALTEERNKELIKRKVAEHRGTFGQVVEFAWKHVRFGTR